LKIKNVERYLGNRQIKMFLHSSITYSLLSFIYFLWIKNFDFSSRRERKIFFCFYLSLSQKEKKY
jgi:hypothetical protein